MSASCGTITVEEPFDESAVSVNCGGFDVTGSVDTGEEVPVLFEFINQNPMDVRVEYSLNVNGSPMFEGTQTVPGTDSRDLTEVLVFEEAGNYDVTADIVGITEL